MSRGSIQQINLSKPEDIQVWEFALETLAKVQTIYPQAIIAGGLIRDLLTDRSPKDIDIFIPYLNAEEGLQELSDSGLFPYIERTMKGSEKYPLDFLVSNWANDVLDVQFIFHPVDNAQGILDRFPALSSRICYDGKEFLQDKDFRFFLHYNVNLFYEDCPNFNPEYMDRVMSYYPDYSNSFENGYLYREDLFNHELRYGALRYV